jgi:hypothetical protein
MRTRAVRPSDLPARNSPIAPHDARVQLIAPATLERFTQQLNLADTEVLKRTGFPEDKATAAVEAVMNPQKTPSAAPHVVGMTEAIRATLAHVEAHQTSAMEKNPDAMRIAAGLLNRKPELADFFNANMLLNGGNPRDMDWLLVCPEQGRDTQVYNLSTGMGANQFQDARKDALGILGGAQIRLMRRWQERRTDDGRRTFSNYVGQTGRDDGNDRKEEHEVGAVQVCDVSRRMLETYGAETKALEMWNKADILWVASWVGVDYIEVLMTGE